MYLHLEQLVDAFRDNPNVRFREEEVGGRKVVIVCYMLSDDELWKQPLGVETRGPCFDAETGDLLALPFEKFFNVNEKAHTQANIVAEEMTRCVPYACEKVDGSMINAVLIDGEIYLKTKKSFVSDVAIAAQAAMTPEVEALSRYLIGWGYTPIYEYTSPDSKIVVNYGDKPEFALIAARSMKDGTYLDQPALDSHALHYQVMRHGWIYTHDLKFLTDRIETEQDIEGWVIYLPSGRYKIKTKWYMDRHRLIDIRERDIAEFVLDETLDDMIPNLIEGGADMEVVKKIEHKIATELANFRLAIDNMALVAKKRPDGVERANWIKANCDELQGFVFRASRDLEVSDESLKDFYKRRYLKQEFSLRSIGNPNFRKVGDDDE